MSNDRLFVAQIIEAIEEQWPDRKERRYCIGSMMFVATDEEDAYRISREYSGPDVEPNDCNHDGPGDLTAFYRIGLHQLEEICTLSELPEEARTDRGFYGVDLPVFCLSDVDGDGIPLVRQREELEVFRLLRLRGQKPPSA